MLRSRILESVGWIGSLTFALSGLPQAYHSVITGQSQGISPGFLILWFLGEVFTILYVSVKFYGNYPKPLLFNYLVNLISLFIISYYYLYPTQ